MIHIGREVKKKVNIVRTHLPEKAYLLILYLVIVGVSIGFTFAVDKVIEMVIVPSKLSHDVRIGGLSLGGLTPEEAHQRLQILLAAQTQKPTKVTVGEKEWILTSEELQLAYDLEGTYQSLIDKSNRSQGIRKLWDQLAGTPVDRQIDITFKWNQQAAVQLLEKIKKEVDQPISNARIAVAGDGVTFTPHQVGKTVQIEETLKQIEISLSSFQAERIVSVSLTEVMPKIVSEDLQPIDTLLAESSTVLPAGFETVQKNVSKILAKINGHMIRPEEEFSFVKAAGPFIDKEEYVAPGDVQPIHEQGGIQFGIGQTASTLYWAALKANLVITERHPHLHPQSYISPGLDAAIWDGQLDLRIQNNFKQPVYIDAHIVGNLLIVRIYGNKGNKSKSEVVVEKIEKFAPQTVFMIDGDLPTGERREEQAGEEGVLVEVSRKTSVTIQNENNSNEEENKILVSKDYYRPISRVVYLGTPTQIVNQGNGGIATFGPGDAPPDITPDSNGTGDWNHTSGNGGGSGFANDPNMAPSHSDNGFVENPSVSDPNGPPPDIPVNYP